MVELRLRALLAATCMVIAVATARAGVVPPGVFALCEATLTDGDTVEGVVLLSRSGLRANPTDGFLAQETRPDAPLRRHVRLFNERFTSYKLNQGRMTVRLFRSRPERYVGERRVFYLRDVSDDRLPSGARPPESTDDITRVDGPDAHILSRVRTVYSRYELLDYVPMYIRGDGPVRTCVERAIQVAKPVPDSLADEVPLADVVRFTLVHRPGPAWVAAIRDVTDAWWASHADDGVLDTMPSLWFHDVVAGTGEYGWLFRTWYLRP
jgi:hypothetical protein